MLHERVAVALLVLIIVVLVRVALAPAGLLLLLLLLVSRLRVLLLVLLLRRRLIVTPIRLCGDRRGLAVGGRSRGAVRGRLVRPRRGLSDCGDVGTAGGGGGRLHTGLLVGPVIRDTAGQNTN